MHNFGKRVKHIYEYGTDMEKEYTTDILNKVVCIAKAADYDTMNYYNLEIRSMVDKELSFEMIDEVMDSTHWTKEDVKSVLTSKGLNVRLEDAYFLANYYYRCYNDIMTEDIILAMTIKDINKAMSMWKICKMSK